MNLYQEEECHRSCKLVWSEKPHPSTHPSMIDIRDTDSVAEGTNGGKCNWIVAVSNCDLGHPHTFLDSLATALLPAEPNEQCNEVLSGVCLHLNSKGNAQCLCLLSFCPVSHVCPFVVCSRADHALAKDSRVRAQTAGCCLAETWVLDDHQLTY